MLIVRSFRISILMFERRDGGTPNRMKIYVSVDMEGIAGILLPEQLRRGEALYEEARRLLTQEVNVIVESLMQLGVSDIIVKDAHGSGFNLIPDSLHPGAFYVMGATRVKERFPGLDSSFTGAFLIGYHAMGGTAHAIRDHTYTSQGWQSVTINRVEYGEIAIDSLLFGLHGVPVRLVTGDEKACGEAGLFIKGVTTYATKRAYGRHAGLLLPPKRVYRELPAVIKESLEREVLPFSPIAPPYEMVVRFNSTDQVDPLFFDGKTSERLDGLTVRYREDHDLIRLLSHIL